MDFSPSSSGRIFPIGTSVLGDLHIKSPVKKLLVASWLIHGSPSPDGFLPPPDESHEETIAKFINNTLSVRDQKGQKMNILSLNIDVAHPLK